MENNTGKGNFIMPFIKELQKKYTSCMSKAEEYLGMILKTGLKQIEIRLKIAMINKYAIIK
jgi:hypothetical protein